MRKNIELNRVLEYIKYVKEFAENFSKDNMLYLSENNLKKDIENLILIEKYLNTEYVKLLNNKGEFLSAVEGDSKKARAETMTYLSRYLDDNILDKSIKKTEDIAYNVGRIICEAELEYNNQTQGEKYLIYLIKHVKELIKNKSFNAIVPTLQEKLDELENYWKEVQKEKKLKTHKNLHEDVDPYGEEDWLEEEIVDIIKLNNISDKLNEIIPKLFFKEKK